ncbi:hypothetical protein [Streptomyces inusitatus]|uniref:hypothetical protein n=1 Tax=Streptomyces inusitatus TaxID=68221 RepID=UPI00167DE7DC|nr:hypothetical protein [Streptomyces inusitatus]
MNETVGGGAADRSGGGVFEAAAGDGPAAGGEGRAAEVRTAYAGLLQIRRVSGTGGTPAPWERRQPVRAVALALEAAGVPPSAVDGDGARTATGYRVLAADRDGAVRVEWAGPAGGGAAREEEKSLRECGRILGELGWEALLYRGPRRRWFLETEALPGPGPG